MRKYDPVKPALLLLATATVGNASDLRAGIVKYDGGPALYSMTNGLQFICDDCPVGLKLIVPKYKPQPCIFSVNLRFPLQKCRGDPESSSKPSGTPSPVL